MYKLRCCTETHFKQSHTISDLASIIRYFSKHSQKGGWLDESDSDLASIEYFFKNLYCIFVPITILDSLYKKYTRTHQLLYILNLSWKIIFKTIHRPRRRDFWRHFFCFGMFVNCLLTSLNSFVLCVFKLSDDVIIVVWVSIMSINCLLTSLHLCVYKQCADICCLLGWEGELCDQKQSDSPLCGSEVCALHQICGNTTSGYTCQCRKGFQGTNKPDLYRVRWHYWELSL